MSVDTEARLLLTKIIHYKITRHTANPCREFPSFVITSLTYGRNGLNESFAENIVG